MPTVPFTNFADGEYGTLNSFNVGFAIYRQHLLYKGFWHGKNVIRTIDGGLCPRAGMKAYTLTGVANGALGGMGWNSYNGAGHLWFASGQNFYSFDPTNFASQAVTTYTGALGTYTDPLASTEYNSTSQIVLNPGSGIYGVDHAAKTVAAAPSSPSGTGAVIYGDRMVVASGNRVYYSAAGNFGSWDTSNWWFDVGHGDNITCLRNLRGRLAIAKATVGTGSWFLLSGVPGFNDLLRTAEASASPNWPLASCDMGAGIGMVTSYEGSLAIFNGTQLQEFPYLLAGTASAGHSTVSAFALRRRGEWGVVVDASSDPNDPTNGSVWIFRNSAWSRHSRDITSAVGAIAYSASVPEHNFVVFGQGGDASHPPTFHAWDPYLERPPFTSDAGTSILDPATVSVTLPEFWDRSGQDICVSAVLVDFRAFNTGDSNPCQFTITPTAMRTFNSAIAGGNNDTADPNPATFTAAASKFSTSGTHCREHMNFSDIWGNGFRIDITNMRGIIIDKIVVVYNQRPTQGI